jgi:ADP-dependent NAD(P)H-hydrate dehydratase
MSKAGLRRHRTEKPTLITAALLRKWPLPPVDSTSGQDSRGRAFVVGGSREIPGSVMLSGVAALRAGAGKLQIATATSVAPSVGIAVPEARVLGLPESKAGEIAPTGCRQIHDTVSRCDALLIGPGMVDGRAGMDLLRACVRDGTDATMIVDAAALDVFGGRAPLPQSHARGIIITPHAGEMAKLWRVTRNEIEGNPLHIAREAAALLGVVIALKGPVTYIVSPDGSAFRNEAGNAGLGTSGSGDALSGIIAGLAARGASPMQATAWGVFLHAKAGEVLAQSIGAVGYLAREILVEIPRLIAKLS